SAPEQIDPETYGEIDWRTDIWQFGCLLYEMIEKEPPFYANYPGQLILKILNETLRSFKKTPEWLKLIILKCLEKKREERWRSISVLIEMLKTKQKPEVVPVAIEIKKASTEKLVKTEYFDNNIHDKIMNILQKMYSWYLKYRRMYGGKESE
ncbi:MAG: protein kinase domain-containing protein, partial [Candidatus Asgardarchaeia archaeon]